MNTKFLLAVALLCPAIASAESATESVYFDEESDATALVEKGDEALKKGDLVAAMDAWQKVLDTFPRSILPGGNGIWLPASVVCSRRLAALPEKGIEVYREKWDSKAAKQLSLGTQEAMRTVAEHYFCTDAGGDAMERLGGQYADAGSMELAVRCWEEVAERHPLKKDRPAMLAKLGLAYVRLGFAEKAKALAERSGALQVVSRGEKTTVGALIAAAAAAPPAAPRSAAILPDLTFGAIPETAPIPRSVKWRLTLSKKQEDPRQNRGMFIRGMNAGLLQTYPSTADGKLFVNLGTTLIALDAASGDFQWLIGSRIGGAETGKSFKLPENYFETMPAEFWGHRWYAVIADGVLYANQTQTGNWCQLKAFQVKNAKIADKWGDPGSGIAPGFDLTGPPLPWRERVYVGGVSREKAKSAEVYLFAFNRRTGALEWKTFIASFQMAGNRWGGNMPAPVFAPVVTASGSYLFVCTNNGALACVSHAGELVWATKYPRPPNPNPWNWWMQSQEDTWDLSPVFATGRDIIFFPTDGTHCCRLDAITGKGYQSSHASDPLKAMKVVARERCRHLVAIEGEIGTLIGDECKEYDLLKSTMVPNTWTDLGPTGSNVYCGRGLVTKDLALVPVKWPKPKLLVYHRSSMKTREDKQWVDWPTSEPPGTLMIAGKLLLSVSTHEIVALSDEAPPEPPKDPKDGGDATQPGDGKKPEDEKKPEEPPRPDPPPAVPDPGKK